MSGNGIAVTYGESVEKIPAYSFYNVNLNSITIGDNVKSIGNSAFYGCTNIATIVIPDNTTSIGNSVFYNCSRVSSITIGKGVASIGSSAFYGCTSLAEITWNAVSVANFSSGSNVFYNAGTSGNGVAVTFGEEVQKVPAYCFYSNSSSYRPKITSIMLGENISAIESYAFRDCVGISDIIIPESVTSIGTYAFYGCTGLTSVYYKGNEDAWDTVSIGSNNTQLKNATVYFYEQTNPYDANPDAEDGKYWHFDGEDTTTPVVWAREIAEET